MVFFALESRCWRLHCPIIICNWLEICLTCMVLMNWFKQVLNIPRLMIMDSSFWYIYNQLCYHYFPGEERGFFLLDFYIWQEQKNATNPDFMLTLKIPRGSIGWSWLVVWALWHINLCMLFNAKSIFMQIFSSISNNSV